MKDFEGAVSAENLGPKYGVYGSFLPIDELVIQPHISQKLPSSSHKPIRIRIKLRSGNTAAPKSSDLHTASDKTHCPELTTSGDESPLAPFIIQEDWIRCSTCNELGESDANAFEGKFRKQKKSKVIQTEKKKSSRSKGEGKSTRRDTGIKDSAPIEREQQAHKYGVKQQSEAECGMMRKPVYKKAIGYGKVARAYIAFW
ncbi:hypothetical protein MTR67_036125 [Solanum verrucosum]|uniref:Uncharacterized protein n=1 Tax=Solanum verrucosum TaxID=315347 RepID=A0AAF0ZM97_SOLVR|nr:hypothetical protein MTR67_036125 [Solanum verrucosum]